MNPKASALRIALGRLSAVFTQVAAKNAPTPRHCAAATSAVNGLTPISGASKEVRL